MFGRTVAVVLALVAGPVLAGCARHAAPARANAARVEHAEQGDLDAAMGRIPGAEELVTSYTIDADRLTMTVDATRWTHLGPAGQDRMKRALWRAWATAYARRNPPTDEPLFVLFEDQFAHNLGSYFERVPHG